MAQVELQFKDDGMRAYLDESEEAPDAPFVFTNQDQLVEFTEVGIGLICIPRSETGPEYLVRLELSLEYRGKFYGLDYQGMPGARDLDSLNRNLSNEILAGREDIFERTVTRAFRVPLMGGMSILLTPGEELRPHVKRFLDPDTYHGELEIFLSGELVSEMQIMPSRRVRMRRRDLFEGVR